MFKRHHAKPLADNHYPKSIKKAKNEKPKQSCANNII